MDARCHPSFHPNRCHDFALSLLQPDFLLLFPRPPQKSNTLSVHENCLFKQKERSLVTVRKLDALAGTSEDLERRRVARLKIY